MARIELYKIFPVEDDEGHHFFCLFEVKTNQVLDFFLFKDDAVNRKEFIERGGAFVGFTPKFMLNMVEVPNNTNEEFFKLLEEVSS